MSDPYEDREQTQAKHFLLKSYLQALAFKILRISDLTYVDGFSGPWKTKSEDFSDSSFMIAITALEDAQQQILQRDGVRWRIRCFFSESDPEAFAKLDEAVKPYHRPDLKFEIRTFCGKFEDAVSEIQTFAGNSFALIFIDPTGWTGYPFEKIKVLFAPRHCEVLINFMYGFVRRFIDTEDSDIISSLDPILGGPGWQERLDRRLPRGEALLMLFRETLRAAGGFAHVVATKIDKATEDRPHFFMAYGTKNYAGLKTFRDMEYKALRVHAAKRVIAKDRKQEAKLGFRDLFADHEAAVQSASIEKEVATEKQRAAKALLQWLAQSGPKTFRQVASPLMEQFMLRETNIKDIVVELARSGKIRNTWGGGNRKPRETDTITSQDET